MKDFKNYTNGENNEQSQSNVNSTIDMVNTLAKAFNGKSEGDIWKTILAQAEQGKRDGTLSNDDLDRFFATVSPLLDGFRRQKLKGVINKLKSL